MVVGASDAGRKLPLRLAVAEIGLISRPSLSTEFQKAASEFRNPALMADGGLAAQSAIEGIPLSTNDAQIKASLGASIGF
jgi:hypothetical protein